MRGKAYSRVTQCISLMYSGVSAGAWFSPLMRCWTDVLEMKWICVALWCYVTLQENQVCVQGWHCSFLPVLCGEGWLCIGIGVV